MNGIRYALTNIQRGQPAGWAAGSEADTLPYAQRASFLVGVRRVEELRGPAISAIKAVFQGRRHEGAIYRHVPDDVRAELRDMVPDIDFALRLLESGMAVPHLPPYGDHDA